MSHPPKTSKNGPDANRQEAARAATPQLRKERGTSIMTADLPQELEIHDEQAEVLTGNVLANSLPPEVLADMPMLALVQLPRLDKLFYKVNEAADILGISRSKVYELIKAEVLDLSHEGRSSAVPVHSIAAYYVRRVSDARARKAA